MDGAVGMIVSYGTRLVGVIVLVVVAWIVAGWVQRLIVRRLETTKFDATLAKFFANMARWVILVLAILAALGMFGVETTSFAALLGGAGLAVGLAFQGSLSNFAAGVMLLVFRPFKVGNVVKIAGVIGKVDEIELFFTTLDTSDNRRFILPNSQVFGAVIENVTFHERRRVDVPVGVDYSADVDTTREVLEAAAARIPDILSDPAPKVVLASLGDSAVDWQVRVWCETANYYTVLEASIRETKLALDEAGIGIPFPQMDVHLDGGLNKSA